MEERWRRVYREKGGEGREEVEDREGEREERGGRSIRGL